MEVEHLFTLELQDSQNVYALSQTHTAIANSHAIELRNFRPGLQETIRLEGHHHLVTSLCFSDFGQIFLISASTDYIIQWLVDEVLEAFNSDKLVRGHIISESPGSVYCSTLSPNNQLVCCVTSELVLVLNIACKEVVDEIFIENVTCVKFVDANLLLLYCQERYLHLWNLKDRREIWKQQLQNGFLNGLVALQDEQKFVFGSSTNMLMEIAFNQPSPNFHEIFKLDLDEVVTKHLQRKELADVSRGNVLALTIATKNISEENESLSMDNWIACATDQAIFLVNLSNHDVTLRFYPEKFQGFVACCAQLRNDSGKVFCCARFGCNLAIFEITLPDNESYTTGLSIIPCSPVLKSSPLSSSMKVVDKAKPSGDQPLTFKNKIKSSGYSASPRMKMFQPITSQKRKVQSKQPIKSQIPTPNLDPAPDWSNEVVSQPITKLCESDCCVNYIAFNERNDSVGFALSDATMLISRVPLPSNNDKIKVLRGHNKTLIGCHWSNQNSTIMTYSSDRQIKLWSHKGECKLAFESCKPLEKKQPELAHAQFFYLDKFVLSTVGNSLLLHKYLLNDGPRDDVKRYLGQSKQKLTTEQPMKSAHSITCLAAANNMFSYLALIGGSDRSIQVFDMNRCDYVHKYDDAHKRAPQAIRICEGSSFCHATSHDVYISSAPSDGVKLWDVRSSRCCRKFNTHSCVSKCDVTMTPCGRFFATSSDDKIVAIYDVRGDLPVQKLKTKDKILSLSFAKDSMKLFGGSENSSLYRWDVT